MHNTVTCSEVHEVKMTKNRKEKRKDAQRVLQSYESFAAQSTHPWAPATVHVFANTVRSSRIR